MNIERGIVIRDLIARGIDAGVLEVGPPFDGDAAARMMGDLRGAAPGLYATILQNHSYIELAGEPCYGFDYHEDDLPDIDVRNRERTAPDGSTLPEDALIIMEDAAGDVYYLRTSMGDGSPVFRVDADLLETSEAAESIVAWIEGWIEEYGDSD